MQIDTTTTANHYQPFAALEAVPYSSDQQFLQVLSELKKHTKRQDGAPIALTFPAYLRLILSLSMGETRECACLLAEVSRSNFYRYLAKSPTFRRQIQLAEQFQHHVALSAVMKILLSTLDRCIKTVDRYGNDIFRFTEGKMTNGKMKFIQWFLERRDVRFAKHKYCKRCRESLKAEDFNE